MELKYDFKNLQNTMIWRNLRPLIQFLIAHCALCLYVAYLYIANSINTGWCRLQVRPHYTWQWSGSWRRWWRCWCRRAGWSWTGRTSAAPPHTSWPPQAITSTSGKYSPRKRRNKSKSDLMYIKIILFWTWTYTQQFFCFVKRLYL